MQIANPNYIKSIHLSQMTRKSGFQTGTQTILQNTVVFFINKVYKLFAQPS